MKGEVSSSRKGFENTLMAVVSQYSSPKTAFLAGIFKPLDN